MSGHAFNANEDTFDHHGRPMSPRAVLANEEIEALLGPGTSATNGLPANAGTSDAGRPAALPTDVRSFNFREFGAASGGLDLAGIAAQGDTLLELRVELGRTYMNVDEVRRLRHGSVVSLDSLADEPVAIYVNNRLVARGELLVMNGTFCVRVLELVGATLAKAG